MYNLLFVFAMFVTFVVLVIFSRRNIVERILESLVSTVIVSLIISISIFYQILDEMFMPVLLVVLVVSIIVILVLNKDKEDGKVIEHIVKNAYLVIVALSVFVFVPILVLAHDYSNVLSVAILVVYYGVFMYLNIRRGENARTSGDYLLFIGLLALPLFFMVQLDSKDMSEVYEYLHIDQDLSSSGLEYIDQVQVVSFGAWNADHYGREELLYGGKLYVLEGEGLVEDDLYGTRVNNLLTIYDVQENEIIYQRSFDDMYPDSHEWNYTKEDQDVFYVVNDEVYLVSNRSIFRIGDSIDKVYEGHELDAFIKNNALFVYDYDDLYVFDGENMIDVDYWTEIFGEDKPDVHYINNHFYTRDYSTLSWVDNIYIDGETYMGDEVSYITDEAVVVGNINTSYIYTEEGVRETSSHLYESALECGDYVVMRWQAGMVLNDYPKPLIVVMNKELEVQHAIETESFYRLVCSHNENIYAYHTIKNMDENRLETYLAKLDFSEVHTINRGNFTEFKSIYGVRYTYLWLMATTFVTPLVFLSKKKQT